VSTTSVGRRRAAVGSAGGACLIAVVVIALLATSAGGGNGTYTVRAIFDDAANAIGGESVKIDGVKVGTVDSVTPTPNAQAAVVLHITTPGFTDFRRDATCTIRPQALLGEKFVDCLPTQPRVEGTPLPPPLRTIPSGLEGAGERLLPVTNTHSPVDPDLVNDINRLPERERLTIILNELGVGLAGRGSDLNVVIRRADPALQELDKVLAILAGENRVLAKLAVDSDQALAPLAGVRKQFADYFAQSSTVAQASARHLGALERNLILFPPFLRELGPSMERLAHFADETTPVFKDLGVAAPGINQTFTHLPAFSKSSETFFTSLGKTAEKSGPAIVAVKPLLSDLRSFGGAAQPFTTNFSSLLTSLRNTGGLERILDFTFLGAGAANGYDALGHFLRTEGLATICQTYAIAPSAGCSAKLATTTGAEAGASSVGNPSTTSVLMARTLAVIKGATPAQALAKYPGSVPKPGATSASTSASTPALVSNSVAASGGATATQPVGGASAGTTNYSPSAEGSGAGGMLLNYLLGN
jgi:phospholipid/cholesterol/gamma-HCH transport system substrate-binding protein